MGGRPRAVDGVVMAPACRQLGRRLSPGRSDEVGRTGRGAGLRAGEVGCGLGCWRSRGTQAGTPAPRFCVPAGVGGGARQCACVRAGACRQAGATRLAGPGVAPASVPERSGEGWGAGGVGERRQGRLRHGFACRLEWGAGAAMRLRQGRRLSPGRSDEVGRTGRGAGLRAGEFGCGLGCGRSRGTQAGTPAPRFSVPAGAAGGARRCACGRAGARRQTGATRLAGPGVAPASVPARLGLGWGAGGVGERRQLCRTAECATVWRVGWSPDTRPDLTAGARAECRVAACRRTVWPHPAFSSCSSSWWSFLVAR